jgi:hypothetical protein
MDSERGIVFMSVHESVDLACEMEANPANLSFTWHFEAEDSTGNFLACLYQNFLAFKGGCSQCSCESVHIWKINNT